MEKEIMNWETSNSGNPWTDDELRLILSLAPTKYNCILLAKAFRRGLGSIQQIYRWANTSKKTIAQGQHCNNAFVKQIKRIYSELTNGMPE